MFDYFRKLTVIYKINNPKIYLTIFLFNMINTFFEVLNIALLLPLSLLIFKDSASLQSMFDFLPSTFFHITKIEQVSLFLGLLLLAYILKIVFFLLGNWYQSKHLYSSGNNICNALIKKYLSVSYLFHLEKTSSFLIRNIYQEVNQLLDNNIKPLFHLINDLLILAGIFIFLAFVDVTKFFYLLFVSSLFLTFFYLMRSYFLRYGKKRQYFDETRLVHLQNLLNSIQEIKIYNREKFFSEKFNSENYQNYKYAGKNLFLSTLPRALTEILLVLIIGVFFIFQSFFNINVFFQDIEKIILFSAAIIRFVPLVSRINVSINSLRFGYATMNLISNELSRNEYSNLKNKTTSNFQFTKKIDFKNVSYQYKFTSKKNIDNLSFSITKGSLVKIVGESGSGKTTIINLLLGFLTPTAGNILIDDINIEDIYSQWISKIGFVSQKTYLLNDTIKNNIIFGDSHFDQLKFEQSVELSNLNRILKKKENYSLDSLIHENGKNLSGGEIQRIGIARAIYNGSDVIIFDEPTSGLDYDNSIVFEKMIYSLRGLKTVIIVSHEKALFNEAEIVIDLNKLKNKN